MTIVKDFPAKIIIFVYFKYILPFFIRQYHKYSPKKF